MDLGGSRSIGKNSAPGSVGQRRGADLKVNDQGFGTLAPFFVPGSPVSARCPDAAPLPTRGRVIDSALETLGIEPERIGNAQRNESSADQRVHAVEQIA